MSVEWLKNQNNNEPFTLPRDREVNNGPTAIERSCFQEIRELKTKNTNLKKRLKEIEKLTPATEE